MAPSSILAAGAGAAAGVLATGLAPVALLAGAAAYAGVVAMRMPRTPADPHEAIDPKRLREPWRYYVREALDAQKRFDQAVAAAGDGPVRDRLETIGGRVADGVAESWRIAVRGEELEKALYQLDSVEQVERRIAGLRRERRTPTSERLIDSLRSQVETYRRIEQTAADARARLQLMDARLDETVARAVELGLQPGSVAALEPHPGGLGQEVEDIVTEMEALRRGLDETAGRGAPM